MHDLKIRLTYYRVGGCTTRKFEKFGGGVSSKHPAPQASPPIDYYTF